MSPPPRPSPAPRSTVPRALVRPLRPLLGPILELALDGATCDACAIFLFDADGHVRLLEQRGLLPAKESAGSDGPRPETAAPVESRAGALRVLIIDDEPAIRRSLSTFLNRRGHRVDLAADGAEALEKLLHEEYDAVVCDIRMPGTSGMVLFRMKPFELAELEERVQSVAAG